MFGCEESVYICVSHSLSLPFECWSCVSMATLTPGSQCYFFSTQVASLQSFSLSPSLSSILPSHSSSPVLSPTRIASLSSFAIVYQSNKEKKHSLLIICSCTVHFIQWLCQLFLLSRHLYTVDTHSRTNTAHQKLSFFLSVFRHRSVSVHLFFGSLCLPSFIRTPLKTAPTVLHLANRSLHRPLYNVVFIL